MDGELGAYMRAQIAKAGLFAFDKMWDNGYPPDHHLHQADQRSPRICRA